ARNDEERGLFRVSPTCKRAIRRLVATLRLRIAVGHARIGVVRGRRRGEQGEKLGMAITDAFKPDDALGDRRVGLRMVTNASKVIDQYLP
ncbi:MAG: hypothetical protein Q8J93_03825, partial [Xanthomonadales bacterium]|nr:hypothetical protein [Xanthomonadales bacterium]